MAGYRELLAVEWDDNAIQTFKLNFPNVPVYHGDITKLSVEHVLEMTGLQVGELDVLDGSPPCQGFSTAGKRDMNDPRNQLFREYVRLIRGLQPKVFVMENVSGMIKGKMKLIFVDILKELKACGYRVSARLMNAMYFNVPQSRERMIFIGVREDLGIEPSHPRAQHKAVTAKEAIHRLTVPTIDLQEAAIRSTWQMHRVLKGIEQKKHFGLVRLVWNEPAPTITKDAGNTTTGMVHPLEIRKLTISEIKRLASYPDAFQVVGSFKEKWARIGNSVPPLFMRSVAQHIKNIILNGP
jgi:DNA (cytosine-5)-methyltransferase 1